MNPVFLTEKLFSSASLRKIGSISINPVIWALLFP